MQPCITPITVANHWESRSTVILSSYPRNLMTTAPFRYKDVCWIQNMQTTAYSTCSRNLLFSDFYLEIRWLFFCGAVTLCFREFFQQNFVCTVDTVKNAFQYRCKFLQDQCQRYEIRWRHHSRSNINQQTEKLNIVPTSLSWKVTAAQTLQ